MANENSLHFCAAKFRRSVSSYFSSYQLGWQICPAQSAALLSSRNFKSRGAGSNALFFAYFTGGLIVRFLSDDWLLAGVNARVLAWSVTARRLEFSGESGKWIWPDRAYRVALMRRRENFSYPARSSVIIGLSASLSATPAAAVFTRLLC